MLKLIIKNIRKKARLVKIRREFNQIVKQNTDGNFDLFWADKKLIYNENTAQTSFDRHYVYHPAWAARKIAQLKPKKHIDISSTLHFVSILSAFFDVEFYDYRPANLVLDRLKLGSEDLTNLTFNKNSVSSLSCMHTIEHVGLGRYGDPIDYFGDLKAIRELCRVLEEKGNLFVVVPVGGKNKIIFNAHRIYRPEFFISQFESQGLKLLEFTLIPDSPKDGHLIVNPNTELMNTQKYGCGCFWFTKE